MVLRDSPLGSVKSRGSSWTGSSRRSSHGGSGSPNRRFGPISCTSSGASSSRAAPKSQPGQPHIGIGLVERGFLDRHSRSRLRRLNHRVGPSERASGGPSSGDSPTALIPPWPPTTRARRAPRVPVNGDGDSLRSPSAPQLVDGPSTALRRRASASDDSDVRRTRGRSRCMRSITLSAVALTT